MKIFLVQMKKRVIRIDELYFVLQLKNHELRKFDGNCSTFFRNK